MFLHQSFCSQGSVVVPQHPFQVVSQHALQVSRGVFQHVLQVSRPTPKGEVEGSGLGLGRSGGVSRPTPGGSPGKQPPTSRWLLLRAVCILLECILVSVNRFFPHSHERPTMLCTMRVITFNRKIIMSISSIHVSSKLLTQH